MNIKDFDKNTQKFIKALVTSKGLDDLKIRVTNGDEEKVMTVKQIKKKIIL